MTIITNHCSPLSITIVSGWLLMTSKKPPLDRPARHHRQVVVFFNDSNITSWAIRYCAWSCKAVLPFALGPTNVGKLGHHWNYQLWQIELAWKRRVTNSYLISCAFFSPIFDHDGLFKKSPFTLIHHYSPTKGHQSSVAGAPSASGKLTLDFHANEWPMWCVNKRKVGSIQDGNP